MMTYDLMETARNTQQWMGASAKALASYPMFSMTPNPALNWMAAWGEVTERSFERMVVKPDWGIRTFTCEDGKDHLVEINKVVEKPFGDLIHFDVRGRETQPRKVLLVAPMSGHYATLLRSTVKSLMVNCEVYVTDWHNARDIPVSAGKFDIEDYTLYLVDFMREMGPDTHVVAVCQPVPLTLAATAYLAEQDPDAQPRSLTLIGGPVDPDAAPTDVTDFGARITMGQLENTAIQRVGFKHKGVGRKVYPGLLQLASFVSMNSDRHKKAFTDQIQRAAQGETSDHDDHNRFYDEYLAVMDMTAEFYLSTVERIFKTREIARNEFIVDGHKVDFGKITRVAVKTVEGENDDISAPGQCIAALDLCTGLPDSMKASHLEPGAGHYGIFAGKSWRDNIRPLVIDFMNANSGDPVKVKAKVQAEVQTTTKTVVKTAVKTAAKSAKKDAKKASAKASKPAAKAAKTASVVKAVEAVKAVDTVKVASTAKAVDTPKAVDTVKAVQTADTVKTTKAVKAASKNAGT